ncbi:hypothetical protein D9M68_495550 [compost metagenome]
MGQGVHIAFDVGLAFQLGTHALHGRRQLAQLAAAHVRQFRAPALAHRLGVVAQAAQRAAEPPGQQPAHQQAEADQPCAEPGQARLRALDVGLQRGVGLGHRDDADDPLAVADGRRHVHDRGLRVVRVLPRGAGAVLAAQGQVDVVPARIVLAHRHAAGVQQYHATAIGDVDAVVDPGLAHAPDIRPRLALAIGAQQFGQAPLVQGAGAHLVTEDFGQQVGGVHQGLFGGLAHAGADLLHHRAEHEPAGQADEEEVDQEDANAQRHQAWPGE